MIGHLGAWSGLADRIARARRRLRDDRRGLALVEFALGLPLVLVAGGYGIELSNLALANLRVSQIALNLADNASRVGLVSNLATTQLREVDLNDVLAAAKLEGAAIGLTSYGRVTISSLENIQQSYDTTPVQRIHWQRCLGVPSGTGYDSTYGTAPVAAGTTNSASNAGTVTTAGMGDAGSKVSAPQGAGLMFVEVNYRYRGLFGSMFVAPQTIHYIASLIVRDRRDFAQIYNPSPTATRSTCDLHTA